MGDLMNGTKTNTGDVNEMAKAIGALYDQYTHPLKLDPQQLQELNPAAIAGVKEGPYGAEALVRRQQIPAQFVTEHTNLEDIILFLAKGEGS